MLKKTHKSTCSRKDCTKCSVCNCNSTKTVLYVCESGHVACQHCQNSDESERQDSGDFVCDKKCIKHRRSKSSRSITSCAHVKDLASGDHDKCSKTNVIRKSKSQCKVKACGYEEGDKSSLKDTTSPPKEVETILEYKNTNYRDSRSSSSSFASFCSNHETEYFGEMSEHRICPRPVICPVQNCGKVIALDSVMLHFYFDHSKVPRLALTSASPKQLMLKPSLLNRETQCLAVFLLKDTKTTSIQRKLDSDTTINGSNTDNKSLFLMGARIQIDRPRVDRNVSKKKGNTSISLKKNKMDTSLNESVFDSSEILMLWLCKLDDSSNSYGITLLKNDKKQGHNYIGEPSHIRDEQSALSMYQRSECLIVHGVAANKLIDEQNQISTLVSII